MVFAIGVGNNSYTTVLAGRFIFGLGGECMTICQSCIVSQWFKGKELAFAFGINLSVARLGSVLNGIIEPQIAGSSGTPAAIWFGLYICIFSWCCGMVLVVIDSYADKKDGTVAKLGDDDKFKCRQICEFSLPFWLIAVSCVTVYCAIFPYNTYCAVMLEREWNLSENFAGAIYSLPFLISAGVSPFQFVYCRCLCADCHPCCPRLHNNQLLLHRSPSFPWSSLLHLCRCPLVFRALRSQA